MTRQEFKRLHHVYRYHRRYSGSGWGWDRYYLDSWLLGYIFNREELNFIRRVL